MSHRKYPNTFKNHLVSWAQLASTKKNYNINHITENKIDEPMMVRWMVKVHEPDLTPRLCELQKFNIKLRDTSPSLKFLSLRFTFPLLERPNSSNKSLNL